MEIGARQGQTVPRMGSGTWAVADQALYAGTNFVLNVALARALTPEAYGAFTTAFIAFLLLGAVHGGLLVEPVLVFGAGRFSSRRADYLRWAVRTHAALASAIALVLGGAGAIASMAGLPGLGAALVGFAFAQAGILLHWLLRRACHLAARPEWAAGSGVLYLVLVGAGLLGLDASGSLSALSAALLMGAASLVASALLAIRLDVGRGAPSARLDVAAGGAHRGYGRYAALSGILEWGQGALPFLVVPALAGLEGAAQLRAVYNLAMPALQAGCAVTVMIVPTLVAARVRGVMAPTARRAAAKLATGAVAYGLLVGFLGGYAIDWLYGGAYTAGPEVRWALATLPLASVLAGLLAATLRAQERPGAVFGARAGAVGVGALLAVILAARAGVAGALAAAAIMLFVEAALLAVRLRRPVASVGAARRECAEVTVAEAAALVP